MIEEQEKLNSQGFIPKMKECPWCGCEEWASFHDLKTSYFLLGYKGKLSEIKENPTELIKNLTDFAMFPVSCKKCGYTIFFNRVWAGNQS